MRRFACFLIYICICISPVLSQTSKTDSIIGIVKDAIGNGAYKKAWRVLHANKISFIQSKKTLDYNISLSDIYKGTYQFLDDDTLRNDNKEALEYIAEELFNGRQQEIELSYGSMWERLFWLSRIYHSDHETGYRFFTERCRDLYKKSIYKNDPYYIQLIITYINYAIFNNEDWSYVLWYTPINEIKEIASHSNIDLAVFSHQIGIAYLQKDISNRKYHKVNSDDYYSNILVEIGKSYLDVADSLYKKCKPSDVSLLRKQLHSDYRLFEWLANNQVDSIPSEHDVFAKPVCLFQLNPLNMYSSIGTELNSIQVENYETFKKSLLLLKEEKYRESVNSIKSIAPSLIVPYDIMLVYFNLISSLAMYDGEQASMYLNQYYDRIKHIILPRIYKHSTEYENQRVWKGVTTTIGQACMKTALRYPNSDATILAYNIFQTIKNFELEVNNYIRYAKKNHLFDELTEDNIKFYNQKRDSLYFSDIDGKNYLGNAEQLELNKMLINDKIDIDKVLNSVYTYKEISKSLNSNASLIEYFIYVDLEGENRYGAFVVNTEKKTPTVIDICSVDEASSHLTKDSASVNISYSSSKLYSTFIQKVEPYILHDTLVVCPVGVLEMVNFDAIANNGHRLMDKYQIYRAYSGHSFINGTRNHRYSPKTAALFGGIAYSKEQKQEAEAASRHFRLSRGTHSYRGSLQYLQYSAEEIAAIRDILVNNKFKCNIYSGLDATESSFKKLEDESIGLIHIATHGFFMRKDSDLINHSFFNNLELYQDYKLLRSGLFMSNSNSSWKGVLPKYGNEDDGIITSYEISKMDLSNVKLAVLSACETAEGFVDNIENTQGLQYAFRMAGTGSMILNLWKVDDSISYLFMKHFYSSLFSKHDLLTAYHDALKIIKTEYPDPYDWAGFILVFN